MKLDVTLCIMSKDTRPLQPEWVLFKLKAELSLGRSDVVIVFPSKTASSRKEPKEDLPTEGWTDGGVPCNRPEGSRTDAREKRCSRRGRSASVFGRGGAAPCFPHHADLPLEPAAEIPLA